IHTVPGSASMVASAVAHAKWERVIGTVAGDDTVLIITNNPDSVPKLVKLIISLMKE
ncbi:MAG: arginine repressor, partial [Megasphaera micronuciformis]|nr:arginine repressor [Megasphaera micronuciformis]